MGGKNNSVFCSSQIGALVAMATYSFHRLILYNEKKWKLVISAVSLRIFEFLFVQTTFGITFVRNADFIFCLVARVT